MGRPAVIIVIIIIIVIIVIIIIFVSWLYRPRCHGYTFAFLFCLLFLCRYSVDLVL